MMERIEVKECHKYLLEIAKIFHYLCVKHKIPYYMLGGTQLGAIRHQGFIPWDDDMDFGVLRCDYKRLMEILEKELPPHYKVHSIHNSNNFIYGFIKIENTQTLIKEVGFPEKTIGLNIDIFPLDYTNKSKGVFSKNYWISQLAKLEAYCFADMEEKNLLKRNINKLLKCLRYIINNKTLFAIIDKYLIVDKGEFLINHYGAYGLKEITKKDIFGTPVLYKFEDAEFYGVEKYDNYLRHFYGDYMQLPKGKANHFHIEELYLIC